MRKLLTVLLFAGALGACSTSQEPMQSSAPVVTNCSDAKALVKINNQKIGEAFKNRDATAIGALELENRDIVHANMACFPKLEKKIKYWEKMHKDMES